MQKFRINIILLSTVFILMTSDIGFAYAQESSINQFYTPATEGLITFANNVAESVPKIVAAIILLIIGLVAGKIVGRVVEKAATRILLKVNFQSDADTEIRDLSTNKLNSAKLIAATIKWFVYIFFIVAAINALEFVELSTALTDLWLWVPNLLAFILILIIGSIIVKYVIKWVDQEIVKHGFGNSKYVITGIKVVMYGIIFSVAITQLGVGESIIPILVSAFAWSVAIAVGAAIAVGLGFTLKDVLPAAISGVADHRSILKVGKKIKIGDVTGTITSVGTLHIVITNEKNEGIVIPTKEFIGKTFTILSSN